MNFKEQIHGGYILISRTLMESKIWMKPPLYLKIWMYLLMRAQHTDYKNLKRGQLWTSVPEIQKACSHYIGYKKVTPTYKQVRSAIEWMRSISKEDISCFSHEGNNVGYNARHTESKNEGNMIDTTKGTHGMLVNIVNYNIYQDPKVYEGRTVNSNVRHDVSNNQGNTKEIRRAEHGQNINKNEKNDKNKNNKYPESVQRKFDELRKDRGRATMSDEDLIYLFGEEYFFEEDN